jgi:hypothetical protein
MGAPGQSEVTTGQKRATNCKPAKTASAKTKILIKS